MLIALIALCAVSAFSATSYVVGGGVATASIQLDALTARYYVLDDLQVIATGNQAIAAKIIENDGTGVTIPLVSGLVTTTIPVVFSLPASYEQEDDKGERLVITLVNAAGTTLNAGDCKTVYFKALKPLK